MFAASVGKKQIGKSLLAVLAGVVLIFAAVYVVGRIKGNSAAEPLLGATEEQREAYLLSMGIQVDATSSVAEVGVPTEFDERFAAYNEMLRTTGFDLEPYKGETVKKCTYIVTNRQDLGTSVQAVLLVKGDEIIAGHLVDTATGKLYPLSAAPDAAQEEDTTEETILPTDEPVSTDEPTTDLPPDGSEETISYPSE